MPGGLDSLRHPYAAALASYLATPNEESLRAAGDLGQRALRDGLGILDVLSLHEAARTAADPPGDTATDMATNSASAAAVSRSSEFLRGALAPLDERFLALPALRAELERSSETLALQRDQFETVSKELEALRYSVSHDLRAPLRAIDGFSAILEEEHAKDLDEDGRHCLGIVRSSAQRLGKLIEDMLLLVRVGRAELSRQSVDVSALAREVADQLQLNEPQRRVAFTVPDGITADADLKLLRIVLENLIGNAWKFTAKAAEARVEFGQVDGTETATYFVRDNGVGFDMAYAQRLFTPFQRLHAESEFSGTGIGLAVVRRIVERHGGRAWFEAALNGGATFFFTLPPALSRNVP